MDLIVQHIELHVTSLSQAKEFYVTKLGLPILDEFPEINLLAVKAGDVRISIFGGFKAKNENSKYECGAHIIFRTEDLKSTIQDLKKRGVVLNGDIVTTGNFIKDVATTDPDGNVIEFAEYLRDPLS